MTNISDRAVWLQLSRWTMLPPGPLCSHPVPFAPARSPLLSPGPLFSRPVCDRVVVKEEINCLLLAVYRLPAGAHPVGVVADLHLAQRGFQNVWREPSAA